MPGIDKVSALVGLVGGVLGIVATAAGAVAFVIAYFATRDQLAIVDCYMYYGQDSLSYQTDQIQLLPQYKALQAKAVEAKIASQREPQNAALRLALEQAVQAQNEEYKKLQEAQDNSRKALEEQKKCGHKGPREFQ